MPDYNYMYIDKMFLLGLKPESKNYLRHRLLYNWTVHGKWRYCITALKSPPVHRIEFVF